MGRVQGSHCALRDCCMELCYAGSWVLNFEPGGVEEVACQSPTAVEELSPPGHTFLPVNKSVPSTDCHNWQFSMGGTPFVSQYLRESLVIGRTSRQPNYPNQLAPKRESQRSLRLDPNLTWWAYQAISLLSRPGTLSAGGLISPLFLLAFDGTFDQLQLIRATLIFKMQKDW